MERRRFFRLVGLGLAGTWAGGRLARPFAPLQALAGNAGGVRLACLADAHLKDGGARRPEALALARAVSEIRALQPPPDLVLFAGDLTHRADPRALALGREILADLPAPLAAVMGEGDGRPDPHGPWHRFFGEPSFSRVLGASPNPSLQVLALHTAWHPGPAGPGFSVGNSRRGWLARQLETLDPGLLLVVLSHAPLGRLFRPWHQWTGDAPQVLSLLSRFPRVFCFHGHTHHPADGNWGRREYLLAALKGVSGAFGPNPPAVTLPGNPQHRGLPATAWPGPLALQGTPARRRPGAGPTPRGCGWALASFTSAGLHLEPRLWLA